VSEIRLRRAVDEDCVRFYRWWSDPEVQRFVGNPRSRLDWETHLAWFVENVENPLWFVGQRVPLPSRDGHNLGLVPVGAIRVDRVGDRQWVSIVLDRSERGRGYGTSMLDALGRHCSGTVFARIHGLNTPSIRAFEKAKYVPAYTEGAWVIRRKDYGALV
jgi:RimJ/RimL family protein N-acetyltransferase